MNKKHILRAWLIFFGGLSIEIAAHYSIRIKTNIEIIEYEPLWFIIQIALATIASYFLAKGTFKIKPITKRLLFVGLQLSIGFILYLAILLWYVTGTGLDSL